MDYKQAVQYLDSFVNYEKKVSFSYKTSFDLERVRILFEALSVPCTGLPVIHIAGTKGKGSVASFCAGILAASGYRVGLYTSPHFFDFRERIRILIPGRAKIRDGMISRTEVAENAEKIKSALALLARRKIRGYTFFEVYTALALKYFLSRKLDFIVLETGLGGRLDATNVIDPLVSVITHIGYDHTEKLGRSLAAIAFEKSGIIKPCRPVVCGPQAKAARQVIMKKARQMAAPLYYYGRDFRAERVRIRRNGTVFDFISSSGIARGLLISLFGRHQAENACLALSCMEILKAQGRFRARPAVKQGLLSALPEGRAEVVSRNPLIMIDVAHNPSSFTALADTVKICFPKKKIILVLAAAQDKDVKNMVNKIKYNKIILTAFNSPRSFPASELKARLKIKEADTVPDSGQALNRALELSDKNSIIIVAGSFFLAAEAKRALKKTAFRV